jgi:hypothetical protein
VRKVFVSPSTSITAMRETLPGEGQEGNTKNQTPNTNRHTRKVKRVEGLKG